MKRHTYSENVCWLVKSIRIYTFHMKSYSNGSSSNQFHLQCHWSWIIQSLGFKYVLVIHKIYNVKNNFRLKLKTHLFWCFGSLSPEKLINENKSMNYVYESVHLFRGNKEKLMFRCETMEEIRIISITPLYHNFIPQLIKPCSKNDVHLWGKWYIRHTWGQNKDKLSTLQW